MKIGEKIVMIIKNVKLLFSIEIHQKFLRQIYPFSVFLNTLDELKRKINILFVHYIYMKV